MASISSNMNIQVTTRSSSITSTAKAGIRLGIYVNWTPHNLGKKIRAIIQKQRRGIGRMNMKVRAVITKEKPEACTADELHYVRVPNTCWLLALWRYLPPPNASAWRNHPVLMLSGVGSNATVFDLSFQFSFARYLSGQGFDTWILEVRGSGLSMRELESSQKLSKSVQATTVRSQIKDHDSQWVSDYVDKIQDSILWSFPQLNQQIAPMIEDFRRQLDLFLNSDWDFDQLLKEDLPLVVDYIKARSNTSDGKLFGIGHSMGGILLYAMLSLCGFEGRESNFAAIATLASTLDYSSSKSSFKLLLPLTDPAEALNIPSIPIGALASIMHPLPFQPQFFPSWLNSQISVQDMMLPELFAKLEQKNFCTIPVRLLLQLATAFESTGLCDRTGTFFYKDHLSKTTVPILALAGDRDLVCPPEAVYETVKMIPDHIITYKVFGEPGGPHYAHFDLIGGHFATKKVYPCIIDFLGAHDKLDISMAND